MSLTDEQKLDQYFTRYKEIYKKALEEESQKKMNKNLSVVPKDENVVKKIPIKYSLETLRNKINDKLIGQSDAIEKILPYIIMYQTGFCDSKRPVGSFLLLGPTGVGKTSSIEQIAKTLHGSEDMMIRIDCGAFEHSHEVAKLLGAPPGYIGFKETQPLITQERLKSVTSDNCKLSIVLFDEIEKAHPNIMKSLLSILDKAFLSLGDGTTVNFKDTLVFFSSNLGAEDMFKLNETSLGFASNFKYSEEDRIKKVETIGTRAVKKKFSPEMVNRLDEIIVYKTLSKESTRKIFDNSIINFRVKLVNNNLFLVLSEDSNEFLISKGFSKEYGARELNRTLQRNIVQPISIMINEGHINNGSLIKVEFVDNKLEFNIIDRAEIERAFSCEPVEADVDENNKNRK